MQNKYINKLSVIAIIFMLLFFAISSVHDFMIVGTNCLGCGSFVMIDGEDIISSSDDIIMECTQDYGSVIIDIYIKDDIERIKECVTQKSNIQYNLDIMCGDCDNCPCNITFNSVTIKNIKKDAMNACVYSIYGDDTSTMTKPDYDKTTMCLYSRE